jgi:hypothetical protein
LRIAVLLPGTQNPIACQRFLNELVFRPVDIVCAADRSPRVDASPEVTLKESFILEGNF